jgi:hypothetical protein
MMKIATLVGLSLFTAVIGLSPLASAKPIEKENHGEYISEAAKTKTDGNANHGSYVSTVAKSGVTGSVTTQGTISSSVQSIPVSASTLLLFGAGFLALAVWLQRSRRGMAA